MDLIILTRRLLHVLRLFLAHVLLNIYVMVVSYLGIMLIIQHIGLNWVVRQASHTFFIIYFWTVLLLLKPLLFYHLQTVSLVSIGSLRHQSFSNHAFNIWT